MQNENIKCKFCNESFPLTFMYAHRTECNIDNHPEYSSMIETDVQQITQMNLNDGEKFQEAQESKAIQNQDPEVAIKQNLKQQQIRDVPQEQHDQNNIKDLQTESVLAKTTKRCEYCDEIFPKEQLQEHYPNCQVYQMIEQLQIEETKNDYTFNQIDVNNQEITRQQMNPENFSTIIHENISSDGKIVQKIITRDSTNNKIYETIFILDPNSGERIERVSQQRINRQTNQRSFQQNFQNFNNRGQNLRLQTQQIDDQKIIQKIRIQSLGRIKFSNSDQLDQEFKQCSICYMNYNKDEELVLLPCIHRFHLQCISKWLVNQTTCPICKIDIEKPPIPNLEFNN